MKRKVKISILTPTVREKGLALVEKSLRGQSFRDFEWIVVTPRISPPQWWFDKVLPTDYRGIWLDLPKKKKGTVWSLNRDYNEAIKDARGDLVISWQDWTFAKADTLENFWQHYKDDPKVIVSAVGNKYESDSWDVMIWKDPRMRDDLGSYYPVNFCDIEFNLCSVPKEAFYAIGGWDEGLDKWVGMDGYSVVDRLENLGGWDFKIDQSIKSYSLGHGRIGGEKWWEENNALHGPYERRRKNLVSQGKWPILEYLHRV